MTDVIVELPLRTIHYKLLDRPVTPLEQNALALYKDLHIQVWDNKLYWEQGRPVLEKLYILVRELQQLYNQMEHETRKYGWLAGFEDKDVPMPPGQTEMQMKPTDLEAIINAYSEKVDEYNVVRDELDELISTGDELLEQFNKAFDYYNDNVYRPIIQDYDNVQIDTVSYDDDFDDFRDKLHIAQELRDDLVDDWNDLANDINILSTKMHKLNPHIGLLNTTINSLPPLPGDPSLN